MRTCDSTDDDYCCLYSKLLIFIGVFGLLLGGVLIWDAYHYKNVGFKNHMTFASLVFGIGLLVTAIGMWHACKNFKINGLTNSDFVNIIMETTPFILPEASTDRIIELN